MTEESTSDTPSVLLNFRCSNVRSFRHELHLSLLPTALGDRQVVRHVPWRSGHSTLGVLPVLGVFGANASGKSNVLKAMDDMRRVVLTSFRSGSNASGVFRRPYLLDPSTSGEPSRFEIDLVLEGVRHVYGFEIDDSRVLREWAFNYPHGKGARLFDRELDQVELGSTDRALSRAVTKLLRPNALFLSTAAATNHPSLSPLFAWFERNLLLAEADSRAFRQALTTDMLGEPATREAVLALLRAADIGVAGAIRHAIDPIVMDRLQRAVRILNGIEAEAEVAHEGPEFEALGVRLQHRGDDSEMELDPQDESLGTLVWFGVIGPVIRSLAEGSVFLADEIDSSLHPALVARLVDLFQNPHTNPRRAQLIFNSHDSTLLGEASNGRLLGRDQIWFAEKDYSGESRVYPLTEMSPRKEEAIGARYLAGRYGGTPILSKPDFDHAAQLIAELVK